MEREKKLPIGIENFEKIRTEGFYYIDKTGLIKDLQQNWGEVNLFTRPRRFGKSLNMSMLKSFFQIGCDSALFDGLKISKERDLCQEYMGKFPVIYISLKGVNGNSFEAAMGMAIQIINEEARRMHSNLEAGCREALEQIERKRYEEQLLNAGMRKILKYGIACYKKQCRVVLGR